MADLGFPVGGGCVDLRHGHFSMKMYAKMKELGPMGGACAGHAPPRSANAVTSYTCRASSRVVFSLMCSLQVKYLY